MVQVAPPYRGGYQDEEDTTSFRRYSARGHGYPISHDRELPTVGSHGVYPSSRSHHPSPHEPRTAGQSPDSDSNSRPRSRIPVACGRCRKRKIRCSGDTGGPCTNCKNAGNDQCQFLRVSSEPAQMKNECATYDYDSSGGAASRLNCRTGMMPFGPQSFAPQPAHLPLDTYQYRNNSLPTYSYSVKPSYYQMPYGDFTDEPVDYGLQGSIIGNDHLGLSSNYITTPMSGRGWTSGQVSTPQLPKTPHFMDHLHTSYEQSQVYSQTYPLRGSMNSESKNGSMNGMNATLPPPPSNGSVDRMLPPVPSTNSRLAQIGGPYIRSSDGLPSTPTLQSQSQSLLDYSMMRGNKSHNNNAVSDNSSISTGYLAMSSTSPDSLSSSQMAYGSQPSMSMSQQSDIYTPPSTDGLGPNESSTDSSYGHVSGSSKRGSHSSQASNVDGSLSSVSGGDGRSGPEYRYVPTGAAIGYSNYSMPPIQHHIQQHTQHHIQQHTQQHIQQPTPVSVAPRPSISVGADQD